MMRKNHTRSKILLVEDEQSVREAVKLTLEQWYNVTAVDRSSTALELLEKERFDIVLLDIFIKGEGQEGSLNALKEINRKYRKLPVVIVSGTVAWMQKWNELKKLGAYAYLAKPFDRHRAKEMIDRCLKGEKFDKPWG